MGTIFGTTLKLCLVHWKRILLFLCLIALLCITAGLLGNYFLYGESSLDAMVICVVDNDDTLLSRMAYEALSSQGDFGILLEFPLVDAAQAERLLQDNTACAVFTIPQGFVGSVLSGENQQVQVTYNTSLPLQSGLVRLLSGSMLDMLRLGQSGIYASLDYARTLEDPNAYQAVFQQVNRRYLRQILGRDSLVDMRTVSAVEGGNVAEHYFFSALLFFLAIGGIVLHGSLRALFHREQVLHIQAVSGGTGKLLAGAFLAVTAFTAALSAVLLLFCTLAGRLLAFLPQLNLRTFLALCPYLLVVGSLCLCCSVLFEKGFAYSGTILCCALAWLAISGGVVPYAYLSSPLQNIGRYSPPYCAVRILQGNSNILDTTILLGHTAFFMLLSALRLHGKARAGRKL